MGRAKRKTGKPATKLTQKMKAFCIARAATHSIGGIIDEICKTTEFPDTTKLNPPSVTSIHYQLNKLKTKFTIEDLRKNRKCSKKRPISITGEENTSKVKKIHDEFFKKYRFKKHASNRYISYRTGISFRSVQIINKERLHLKFFKRTRAPMSTPKSIERRMAFARWGDELHEVNPGTKLKKAELTRDCGVFVDETTVELIPPHNPKNMGIWRENMPTGNNNIHHIMTKPKSAMAFICASKLIPGNGLYMHWVPPGTITGESYHKFLTESIFPALKQIIGLRNWKKVWWLEDGAPGHHSHIVSDLLNEEFNGKVIGCDFLKWHPDAPGCNWPPYSCDLTVLDYFVNRQIKERCWELEEETGMIQNLNDLRRNFEMATYELDADMVTRSIDAFPERIKMCQAVGGGIFEKYKDKLKIKFRKK